MHPSFRRLSQSGPQLTGILKNIATLWFVGYLPYAPGTWGSLAGLILFSLLRPGPILQVSMIAAGFLVGVAASTVAESAIGEKDSSHIVIDEFVGFFVAMFLLPATPAHLAAAFILFRIFDILKPVPIAQLESTLSRGTGVMADDVMAGIYANLLVRLWIRIF